MKHQKKKDLILLATKLNEKRSDANIVKQTVNHFLKNKNKKYT